MGKGAAGQMAASLLMRGTTKHNRQQLQDEMRMLDANIDGKIQKTELKAQSQIGGMLLKNFDALDKNHDGVIDKAELQVAMKMMGGGRRHQEAAAKPAAASVAGK